MIAFNSLEEKFLNLAKVKISILTIFILITIITTFLPSNLVYADMSGDDEFPRIVKSGHLVKKIGKWTLYTDNKLSKKCYILSIPVKMGGYYLERHSIPRIIVTYMGKNAYTVSVYRGKRTSENGECKIKIDDKVFGLKLSASTYSYTYDSEQDSAIINSMLTTPYNKIVIEDYDITKAPIIDTYSLWGFKEAISYMSLNCKIDSDT